LSDADGYRFDLFVSYYHDEEARTGCVIAVRS
jgi:hypothetical protein